MNGDELPPGLTLTDQMAYIALRGIYTQYRAKHISRACAQREKLKIRRRYEQAVSELSFQNKLIMHIVTLRRETELAKTACRKDPTKENAMRLCDVIDGIEKGKKI